MPHNVPAAALVDFLRLMPQKIPDYRAAPNTWVSEGSPGGKSLIHSYRSIRRRAFWGYRRKF
jgi:hypothetical protein